MKKRIKLDETGEQDSSGVVDNQAKNSITYPMTAKESAFAVEYQVDQNGTQAAIRAGYSARSAAQTASRLLRKDNIKVAIAKLVDERNERIGLTSDWIIERYMRLADSNMADYASWTARSVRMFVSDTLSRKQKYAVQSVTEKISKSGERHISLKLESKSHALDKLGQYKGIFDDKSDGETASEFAMKLRDAVKSKTPFRSKEDERQIAEELEEEEEGD